MSSHGRFIRAATATSMVDFSSLRNGRIEGLNDHPTSATDNYDQAIDAAITDGIERGLIGTSTGQCPSIIEKHRHEPSVRPVQFSPKWIKRPSWRFNFRNHANAAAFYAHRSGYDVAQSCRRCSDRRGEGIFQGCVVADDFVSGTCTNCAYGSNHARQCSFRPDTTHRSGYRPAQRIARREPISVPGKDELKKRRRSNRHHLPPSPPSSPREQPSAENDFILSSTAAAQVSIPTQDLDVTMSGGLGGSESPTQERDPITPAVSPLKHSALGKLRKRRKSRSERAQKAPIRDRSPSVVVISCGQEPSTMRQVHGANRVALSEGDAAQIANITAWVQKQAKPIGRTPVSNGQVFAPGELSAEEFWYVVELCEWFNQDFMRNQYRWHKHDMRERGQMYDWSFWEHFAWEDCDWFRTQVIKVVCPSSRQMVPSI